MKFRMLWVPLALALIYVSSVKGCFRQQFDGCRCNDRDRNACYISTAAKVGYKCNCSTRCSSGTSGGVGAGACGFCEGTAQRCDCNEYCPGGRTDFCACRLGGGNCNGYTERSNCNACNCDELPKCINDQYTIHNMNYDLERHTIDATEITVLANLNVPAGTGGQRHSSTVKADEIFTETYSFQHTSGVSIEVGMPFIAGIPKAVVGTEFFRIIGSNTQTYGRTKSSQKTLSISFTCNGSPDKDTNCSVRMIKRTVSVPYNMTLKHKTNPSCTCNSYGKWTGITAYTVNVIA